MTTQTLEAPMNQAQTLDALFETRKADPAISLLAGTIAAMRADADYFRREDDVASGLFLASEEPAGISDDILDRVLARIEAVDDLDRRAAEQLSDDDAKKAELMALPSPLREAALAALKERGWTFGGFGIRRLALMTGDGTEAELMRVEPGFGA